MNRFLLPLAFVFSLTALVLTIWNRSAAPKIAFVRSALLVDKYEGMKEVRSLYNQKLNGWKTGLDSLEKDFTEDQKNLREVYDKLSKEEKENRELRLSNKYEKVRELQNAIDIKAKEEDEKMTEGVLNQINSFIETYAKKHNFKIVFGTTNSGNILYGEDALDITIPLTDELNKNYKEEK